MKVGVTVLGLHVAAVCAFVLMQGCVTTESQGSGRGAGARHKGPWKHEHKDKQVDPPAVATDSYYANDDQSTDSIYDPVIVEGSSSTKVEPYVAPVTSSTEVYIVQKGDILSRIAVAFDSTTKNLISMNNLSNPDVLYVGQELRVPAGRKGSSVSSTTTTKSTSIKKGDSYKIQKGDTLSEIASAAGVSINDLRSLNNIKNDQIFAGETIDIPSYGKAPSVKSTPKKTKSTPVEPVAEPAPAPLAVASVVEPVETTTMQVEHVVDHVVYPGETLDDISRQYGVSSSDIMRLNNISDASEIKENQRLRIPIAE